MSRQPTVYILASRRNGTIYIGVTSDLMTRLQQHRTGATPGFASKYGVCRLVHFEQYDDMPAAISREKQLKAWRRAWKVALIERQNPFWEDLALGLGFEPLPPYPASLPPAGTVTRKVIGNYERGACEPPISAFMGPDIRQDDVEFPMTSG
jgi:putative endonuclease